MSLIQQPEARRPARRCPTQESRDPIGYLVAGLNRLAQSDAARPGSACASRPSRSSSPSTRSGFKTDHGASRTFARAGKQGQPGARAHAGQAEGRLRPDPHRGRADARRRRHRVRRRGRPARRGRGRRGVRGPRGRAQGQPARSGCRSSASRRRSAASPRSARRWPAPWSPRRSPRATWASPSPLLAPGSVATALGLWGTDEQQQTYLPAFTGDDVAAPPRSR